MSVSIFNDKSVEPTEIMLSSELGQAKPLLDNISLFLADNFGDFYTEWKFYGQKSGWILKMFSKKRNVLFVVPLNNGFRVALTFGEKAVEAINESQLPDFVKTEIKSAKKYAEGRTIQFDVKTTDDCNVIFELIRIKLAH